MVYVGRLVPLSEAHSGSTNKPDTHSAALCHMTKAQLLAMAAEHGIDVRSNIRKPLLIEILEEAGAGVC